MGYKLKKCQICGEIFLPSNGKQICCSKECEKERKIIYDQLYRKANILEKDNYYSEPDEIIAITDYTNENIYISESDRKCKPSQSDILFTEILLSDFGINEAIPEFDTFIELEHWKNEKINSAM